MTVLIDADGCPVVNIAVDLCRKYHISCCILCDTAHDIRREGAETLVFDKGADSVDFAIANRIHPGDIVITQDYGLAALCLTRGAMPLHQDGWLYSSENIDTLLLQRYTSGKLRRAGIRTKGLQKRTQAQNQAFFVGLETLITNRLTPPSTDKPVADPV